MSIKAEMMRLKKGYIWNKNQPRSALADVKYCMSLLNARECVMFHLMWGSVLLAGASGRLFVVFPSVHHLSLGALSDQVSAHARDIFKTMTWWSIEEKSRGVRCVEEYTLQFASAELSLQHFDLSPEVKISAHQVTVGSRVTHVGSIPDIEKDMARDTGWHRYNTVSRNCAVRCCKFKD